MLVAVYGSLKKGYGNHRVMEEANGKFVCHAVTKKDGFIMDGYGYPYIVYSKSPQKGKVAVEIYEVENIEPLDWLEGHPTFYKRIKEKFVCEDGKEIEAWVYIYQSDITPNEDLKENGVYIW